MKNATLRQLRVFESAARHLSVTRAAEELHLTPPAVSIQIRLTTWPLMSRPRMLVACSRTSSMSLAEPPPPPLPPPTDAELVEQFVAAASIADSPVERIGLLKTVMRLIDRAVSMMPAEWVSRMRRVVSGDLDREQRAEQAYNELRTRTLEEANRLAARGRAADL